jgi:pantoate--beta-alanine ligase
MLIARTLAELATARAALIARGTGLALVPTMGALHAGHRALVSAAGAAGMATSASIFVNPLQFNASADLARYPRDEEGDLAQLRSVGCDLVWMPDVSVMYPAASVTLVDVSGAPARLWEDDHRPGHFRGMATVVTKLFAQVRPDAAYFGEKDWQQLQVVKRFVADLHMGLEIVGVETVREADGLALSSRNRFLTQAERAAAPALYQAMTTAARAMRAGTPSASALQTARDAVLAAGFSSVDYLALVDGPSLAPIDAPTDNCRIVAAAHLGSVRLIDNIAG